MRLLLPNIILLLFILTSQLPCWAQEQLRFVSYKAEDGLSDYTIKSITQDEKGFIWIGTSNGLNRYDGYSFKTFFHDPEDSNSIGSNSIQSLYIDVKKQLWVGTRQAGLALFNPVNQQFTHYQHQEGNPNSLSSNEINTITGDAQGNLWISTYEQGLNYLDVSNNQVTRFIADPNNPNALVSNNIRALCLDSRGNLWVGTSKSGISCLNLKTKTFTNYHHQENSENSISEDRINCIYEDADSIIWIGTYTNGITSYDFRTGKFTQYHQYKEQEGRTYISAKQILEDSQGRLWIGSWGDGIYFFNRQKQQFTNFRKNLDDPFSLTDSRVLSMFEDRAGQLWVGTEANMSRADITSGRFQHFFYQKDNPNSLAGNNVYSIIESRQGEVWVGTYDGGLTRYNAKDNKFYRYTHQKNKSNTLIGKTVWSVFQDSKDRVWVANSGGLCLYRPKTDDFQRFLNTADRLRDHTILCLTETQDGTLWMGTWGTGMVAYHPDEKTYQVYRHDSNNPKSISTNSVRTIVEDSKTQLWSGSYNGLNLMDRASGTFQRFEHDPNNPLTISSNVITCLFEDAKKQLWVGTNGGLNKYYPKNQTFTRYLVDDIRNQVEVKGILEDDQGFLWLSTAQGICKFNPTDKSTTWYDQLDGLQAQNFTPSANFKGQDGAFYFGGTNGFNKFYPTKITPNTYKPPVVITNFLLFNKQQKISKNAVLQADLNYRHEIHLKYDENIFAFDFAALNYRQAEKNQYQYKLEGVDEDWVSVNHSYRRATYTRISPGTYTFRVIASNDDGLWNEEGLSIQVIISPPWWNTWWAKIIWWTLPIALAIAFYWYRISSLNQQKELLEKQVEIRTAEIREKNAMLEAQKGEILTQAENLQQANEEILSQKEYVESAYQNVQLLSEIGKEVTANLSLSTIVESAYTSINNLMDATEFGVGLIDEENNELVFKEYIYQEKRLPEIRVPLTNTNRLAVHCLLHDKEILLADIQNDYKQYVPKLEGYGEGELLNSLICIPLMKEGRKLGVISVQSQLKNAYSSVQVNLLRNIAIYMNIALDNANTYTKIEEQKNKLLELDRFKEGLTSMIVHDLKNPLNAIINASEDNSQQSLKAAKQAGIQMLNMVLNILDINKYEDSQMVIDNAPCSLYTITQNAISNVSFLATQKNIIIKNELESTMGVIADKEIIERVFINLLTNAIKYTPNNGRVSISATAIENQLKISVSDTGMGIESDKLEKVFDKFGQVQAKHSGAVRSTGLGLTFCKMAIEAHSGTIGVESELERGSTFWFTLTSTQVEAANVEEAISTEQLLFLNDTEKAILAPYIIRLLDFKIYELSKINKVLSEINSNGLTPNIQIWAQQVKECLFAMNAEKYKKLLDLNN